MKSGRDFLVLTIMTIMLSLAASWIATAWPAETAAQRATGKADRELTADEMAPLMRGLMAWAAPLTGLPVPPSLPKVVYRDKCALQAIVYGGNVPCEDGHAVAAYHDGVMFLTEGWQPDTAAGVSVLLHELVHHMQHEAGVAETPCRAEALEKPAYAAEWAFLRAAGLDPFKAMGTNELALFFFITCMGPRPG